MIFQGHGLNFKPVQLGGDSAADFYTQSFSLTKTYPAQVEMGGQLMIQQATSTDL